jgi:hypothetical protein
MHGLFGPPEKRSLISPESGLKNWKNQGRLAHNAALSDMELNYSFWSRFLTSNSHLFQKQKESKGITIQKCYWLSASESASKRVMSE